MRCCRRKVCELAEPGEYARRAFENGRLDLTEVEGLKTLKEVTRYCAAADQEKLAEAAILSISKAEG